MLSNSRKPLLWSGVALLAAGTAFAATMDATDAGWDPVVALYGGGDKGKAVEQINAVNHAFDVSIRNTKRDESVQEFIDGTMEDLADFALSDFHDRLPNKNGDYRELWVRGEIKGSSYLITQAKEKKGYAVTLKGDRNELAAMSTTVRSKATKGAGDKKAYFIGLRTGLGIGNVRWDNTMTALQELARIGTVGNPQQGARDLISASSETKAKVKKLHPKLNNEDLDVLALLWEAYPSLAPEVSKLGTIEDARTVWSGKDYQQVNILLRGMPERFEENYPELGKYFDRMDDIALIDMKWMDKKGRTLTTIKFDTEKLTWQFSCYVKDGFLLPFRGVKVFEDEPVDPMADTITSTKLVIDARMKLLGVIVKLNDLNLDAFYEPHPGYAEMGVTFTRVPGIKVEGAALGFVPTSLVDAFIPGNIESVTRDFLTVAAKGNGGKGLIAAAKMGIGKDGSDKGVFEAGVDFDALDNFLVKIGFGMVNERLVPSPEALDEAKAYAGALQTAFAKDFKRFEKRGASAAK
ncbi:MAG TPA: hypothetical protein VI299_03895 [Polyangiales bacterium]